MKNHFYAFLTHLLFSGLVAGYCRYYRFFCLVPGPITQCCGCYPDFPHSFIGRYSDRAYINPHRLQKR